ncbi:DgyrCDS8984 [Dimorphilus gyrociliatus]|uniref:DgyrCDS8984 n=1 Tax=Dimorphilus gyrociliatus TaxID=2664684 RepID=A0A7I8VXG6_9ANNE|nr:DgyrCDS8984 [Dimorphilus gyrociliatus]
MQKNCWQFCDLKHLLFICVCFLLIFIVGTSSDDTDTAACIGGDRKNCIPTDKVGYDSIKTLHMQIDDDRNGKVDFSESDEFIRDELKYEDGFHRHNNFHNNDAQISVEELWKSWTSSDVYNWTVDDVLDWLVNDVQLGQYSEQFRINAVDGKTLPRLASTSTYVTKILGIKNAVHSKKLTVKAMDVVLFGSSNRRHNYVKDAILVTSLLVAIGGCWLAYLQHKYSQVKVRKVLEELNSLQEAEDKYKEMKEKLKQAEVEQTNVKEEKESLETKLKTEVESYKREANRLREQRETTQEEICRLKLAEEELEQVRNALRNAEREVEELCSSPVSYSAELQYLLQLTYENEMLICQQKREAAEKRLYEVKEMFEKMTKKKGAFSSLKIAHSNYLDNTKLNIESAKNSIDITNREMQESSYRWLQIEKFCGFSIRRNKGRFFLQNHLYTKHGFPYADSKNTGSSLTFSDSPEDEIPPTVPLGEQHILVRSHTVPPGALLDNSDTESIPESKSLDSNQVLFDLGFSDESPDDPRFRTSSFKSNSVAHKPTNFSKTNKKSSGDSLQKRESSDVESNGSLANDEKNKKKSGLKLFKIGKQKVT